MSPMVLVLMLVGGSALAALFVVVPLYNRRGINRRPSPQGADLAARRARLHDMEREWRAGLIGDEEYHEARLEAERELLATAGESVSEPTGGVTSAVPGRRTAIPLGLTVLTLAVGIYLATGRLDLVVGNPSTQDQPEVDFNPEQIAKQLPDIEARLDTRPHDVPNWIMVGRGYMALGRHAEAVAAMERAVDANGDVPDLLVVWARALAAKQQGDFSGEPETLINRALTRAPAHPDALFFGGLGAAQAGNWDRTRALWGQLREQLPDGDDLAVQLDEALGDIPEP